jgi:hypothetical protein
VQINSEALAKVRVQDAVGHSAVPGAAAKPSAKSEPNSPEPKATTQ